MTEKITCDDIVFDIGSVLYRTFFANKTADDTTLAGLATHVGLTTINKYFKLLNPSGRVVMAFDRSSWRKEYTASDQCLSGLPYKGNRHKDMTPQETAKFMQYISHVKELEELVIAHTTICALACQRLEADDLVAGYVQKFPERSIVIVSSDSDLWQLLKFPNVRIMNPATGKFIELSEYENDANYYLFQKIIRGDLQSDNIRSSFPRVQKTRIRKAFLDPFEHSNMMNEKWTDQRGREFVVKDTFAENKLLIDLSAQPSDIRALIDSTITEAINNKKKYSHFHFMKYLGKLKLDKIASSVDQYIKLLSL